MDDVSVQFAAMLEEKGIVLTNEQLLQFDLYYRELVAWNERMNLTGITEREQVYLKHFYDSVSLSFFMSLSDITSIIDIGSGAGFPSLPLKIVYPHLQVTIVDSLNKRIQFLKHMADAFGFRDVVCVHSRAEDAARDPALRDRFDIATARAVARLNILNELCLPFVKKNGLFIAMKGTDASDEIEEATFSLSELKARIDASHRFELPIEHAERHLIAIRKMAPTPSKYPRKAGIPGKQPL